MLIGFHGKIEWYCVFKAQAASWVNCEDEEEKESIFPSYWEFCIDNEDQRL